MPVKDDYTCMLILDEIIHTCGLCDTEKEALEYAINKMNKEQAVDIDLYGNNSLSGYQQRKEPQIKEEYEKGLVEIIKDKLSVRRKRKGHQL